MLLIAEMNGFGHLEIDVVNKRLRKKINKELNRKYTNESILYIQQDMEIENFIENNVPKRYRKDLNKGWPIRFRVDNWIVDCVLGIE